MYFCSKRVLCCAVLVLCVEEASSILVLLQEVRVYIFCTRSTCCTRRHIVIHRQIQNNNNISQLASYSSVSIELQMKNICEVVTII